MKIRDNETGEVFEYGTNIHHALRISQNGGCLTFENLQNGDGSLQSGDGGYSFVLDDGKTPKESNSPDAANGCCYANIGGFHGDNMNNDGWIPVEERLPDNNENVLVTTDMGLITSGYIAHGTWITDQEPDYPIAWRPLPEPYRPERSEGE